jgi:apolipoprotein N-acyltransferase
MILSIIAAVLLSLSFSSFNLGILSWFGFIPLLIALENKSLRQSFFMAFFCGVIFWAATVYWLIHVTLLGQIILILYLAIYFGVFGIAVYLSRFYSCLNRLFFITSSWVLLEYLRSYLFTGFPWSLMAFSQYKNLPLIQIADFSGVWGVSFLVVLVNVGLYLFLRNKSRKNILAVCVALLFMSLIYGFHKLNNNSKIPANAKVLKVSVVQGNILQHLKWDRRATDFILNNYKEVTIWAVKEKPDLVIWPEASVPGLFGQDEKEFAEVFNLAKGQNINLLVGAVSQVNDNYFNSALLINNSGQLLDTYNKLHLVPFGEFIPFKKTFPFLETIAPIGDITAGEKYTIFKLQADTFASPEAGLSTNPDKSDGIGFGVLICFEDLFPQISRQFIKNGAKFLVNITNDAWYKEGSAPYQHFAASVFRAVENHVYLARAANTGISGIIDPYGRIIAKVSDGKGKDIFVKGYSSQKIYLVPAKPTFYNHFGDLFIIFCLLLMFFTTRCSVLAKNKDNKI